jgi:hypothetical protein
MGATGFPVPVLGCRRLVRPGAAALARLAGVPIFPITAIWEDRRIHVELHPPLPLPPAQPREAFMHGAATLIGEWLGRLLRQTPAALTAYHIDWRSAASLKWS